MEQEEEFLSAITSADDYNNNNNNGNNYNTIPKEIRGEIITRLDSNQVIFEIIQNRNELITVSKEWREMLGESRTYQLGQEFKSKQDLANFYLYTKDAKDGTYECVVDLENIFVDVPKAAFPILDENGQQINIQENALKYSFALQLQDEPTLYEFFSYAFGLRSWKQYRMLKIVLGCGFTIYVEDDTLLPNNSIQIIEGRPLFETHTKLIYNGRWKVERHKPAFTAFHDAVSMNYILNVNQIIFKNPIYDEEGYEDEQ